MRTGPSAIHYVVVAMVLAGGIAAMTGFSFRKPGAAGPDRGTKLVNALAAVPAATWIDLLDRTPENGTFRVQDVIPGLDASGAVIVSVLRERRDQFVDVRDSVSTTLAPMKIRTSDRGRVVDGVEVSHGVDERDEPLVVYSRRVEAEGVMLRFYAVFPPGE